jgi:SPP1 gp7 family putative phage head morphogenesis protein
MSLSQSLRAKSQSAKSANASVSFAKAADAEEARVWDVAYRNILRPPSYEDWESLEIALSGELQEAMNDSTIAALKAFDGIATSHNLAQLERALDAFERVMEEVFDDNLERVLRDRLNDAINRGASAAGVAEGLRDTVAKNKVLFGLQRSAQYYTDDHFARNILPKVPGLVERVFEGNVTPADGLARLRSELVETVSRQDHLLRVTANQAASRAYHYGVLKGGWDAGFRLYQFSAILDENTTAQCTHLHGKVFEVADGVAEAERRAAATPETIKDVAPWFTEDDVVGLDSNALSAIGAHMPPLHANCRSSIEFLGRT